MTIVANQQWHSNHAGRVASKSSFMSIPGSEGCNKFQCNLWCCPSNTEALLCLLTASTSWNCLTCHKFPFSTVIEAGEVERVASTWLVGVRNELSNLGQAHLELMKKVKKNWQLNKKTQHACRRRMVIIEEVWKIGEKTSSNPVVSGSIAQNISSHWSLP